MQVEIPATFSGLDLSDPVALFDQTPADVDGAAIRQALSTALSRVPESEATPKPVWRLRVLAEAGRVLLAEAALASAIHLTQTAAAELADAAPLAHVRLVALWRRGDRDGVIAEADRILAQTTHLPQHRASIRASLREWNIERLLPVRLEFLADFWPDIDAALTDPFGAIQVDGTIPFIDRVGAFVSRYNNRAPDDQAFLGRLRWGSEVHRRVFFVRRLPRLIHAKPVAQRTAVEMKVLALDAAIKEKMHAPDPAPLLAHIQAGRSVMIAQAHAGLSGMHDLGLPLGEIPYSLIANAVAPNRRPEDLNLAAGGPNVAMEFAKLAKLMKKTPRIVRIFPDGGQGEKMEILVCGRKAKIGRGAASLAYLGKAATFFCQSHWNGSGFTFSLTPGPIAADYTQKEDFENNFNAFYAACFERIVQGPPEDMAPDSSFWHFLIA